MKTGLSLVDLAKQITERQNLKADYIADTTDLRMTPETGMEVANKVQVPAIRSTAHGQIGSFVGIPKPYYDRLLEHDRLLLATNVNRWFGEPLTGTRRMVRTLGGDMRAFLSDRYQRIENEEVAKVVLPILFDAEVDIISCEVTERRLYITAVHPTLAREVKVGDVVKAGVTISNSEIGFGAASVKPFAYRLVCLNGMTLPTGKFSQRHVGRRVREDEDLNVAFAEDTLRADDNAILLKMRDTVRAALNQSRFDEQVDRMALLADPATRITGNPYKAVELLAQKVSVSERERGGILRSLIEGADLTAWGMLNAVTAQAHDAESYDRSMELTEVGGKLLTLSPREWKEVATAE